MIAANRAALSVKANGEITHFLIETNPDQMVQIKDATRSFKSLDELITHHCKHADGKAQPITAVPPSAMLCGLWGEEEEKEKEGRKEGRKHFASRARATLLEPLMKGIFLPSAVSIVAVLLAFVC